MSEETKFFEPIDLSPEMQRESEKRDMEIVASMPNATPKYEINAKNLLAEMNVRLAQYVGQFKSFQLEYLILQTIQDFAPWVHARYEIKGKLIDRSEPVAVTVKGGKAIYANPAIKRSDYDTGLVMLFSYKAPES